MTTAEKTHPARLPWPKLIPGTLLRRYKRFLADVRLDTGEAITAHCPNSGSMKGCAEPDHPVYVSVHDNPKRKLKYTWELIRMPGSLVGVNTQVPNRLVDRAVRHGDIPELNGYETCTREVNVGGHSRIDLMLANGHRDRCYVEVKNCTLVEARTARFPDAVTQRGLKHLKTLESLVRSGCRCVMFFLIQRTDADIFQPADAIDPEYGRTLRHVADNGVEILCYDVHIDLSAIAINRKIPHRF